jgi:Diadenosine tetraphosphate (Ap4A) hydrolase and other HIT family hydrolases
MRLAFFHVRSKFGDRTERTPLGVKSIARMNNPVDFARLALLSSGHWTWQVHENQSFLGRLVLHLDRRTEGSIASLSEGEWCDLRVELQAIEAWLSSLFMPDRFNYAQLGNIYPKLHVHVVPRYRSLREWRSIQFHDVRWGKNWAPTPRSPMTLDQTYDFASWMRTDLEERLAVGNLRVSGAQMRSPQ